MKKFLKALPDVHVDTKDVQALDWCELVDDDDDDMSDEDMETLENTLAERLVQARIALGDNTLAEGLGTKVTGGQSSDAEEERRTELRSGPSGGQVSAGSKDNYPGPVAG